MPVGIDVPGNIDPAKPIPEGANGIGSWLVLHNHAYPEGTPTDERHREDAIKLSNDVRNGSLLWLMSRYEKKKSLWEAVFTQSSRMAKLSVLEFPHPIELLSR
ncbi:hypothetical protein ULG90_21030 [Halopseudomonas pachastrellae]|nr:hypothetical protein ULG90_21030 [Halopseudomonas pachastrellae]